MPDIAYQYRGTLVDQIHRGHIVVSDRSGKILWYWGDPARPIFARSAAKPIQAIPVVESGAADAFGVTRDELAVICASHNGEPVHIRTVTHILEKAGLAPDALRCGAEYPMYVPAEDALKKAGVPRQPIYCDCSGKHAGMLITACHLGGPLDCYEQPEHPVQRRITATILDICGSPANELTTAIDGCGVPVHALPLYRFAQGYANMSLPDRFSSQRAEAIRRITGAMTDCPYLVAGAERICTYLMERFGDRLFCKSGASAFYAIGLKDRGIGIAVKLEDGASSIIPYVLFRILRQMDVISADELAGLEKYQDQMIYNNHHTPVGRTELVFRLQPGSGTE